MSDPPFQSVQKFPLYCHIEYFVDYISIMYQMNCNFYSKGILFPSAISLTDLKGPKTCFYVTFEN